MASVVTSTTAEWPVHFVPKGTRPPAPAHFHLIGTAGDGQYDQLAISSGGNFPIGSSFTAAGSTGRSKRV
ncbi:hypothetical protein RRF57_009173 [Xylaria bambusicola]|uniref:Uncharacterized protein n=1 Tax=Xylaria bambusicola TaxID=326684 RepID=A0AAN7UT85_9PEZI